MRANSAFLVSLRVDFDDWAGHSFSVDPEITAAFRNRMSLAFPWSREVFGNVYVLNGHGDVHDVASTIYGCFDDALDDAGANELHKRCIETSEGPIEWNREIRIADMFVCELGEHCADLCDEEAVTALRLIVSRSAGGPDAWPTVWARPELSVSTSGLCASDGVIQVPVEAIESDGDLNPKMDELFVDLFVRAMNGELDVYVGAVPVGRIVPFDLDYRPDRHPLGSQAIDAFANEWKGGKSHRITAYPRGSWLVASDEYISLMAALRAGVEFVPCCILGRPDSEGIKDLRGPLEHADVTRMFGGS